MLYMEDFQIKMSSRFAFNPISRMICNSIFVPSRIVLNETTKLLVKYEFKISRSNYRDRRNGTIYVYINVI